MTDLFATIETATLPPRPGMFLAKRSERFYEGHEKSSLNRSIMEAYPPIFYVKPTLLDEGLVHDLNGNALGGGSWYLWRFERI